MLAPIIEYFDLRIYNTGVATHYHTQTDTTSVMVFLISRGLSPRICLEVNTIFYCLFPRATLLPMSRLGVWTGLTELNFRNRQRAHTRCALKDANCQSFSSIISTLNDQTPMSKVWNWVRNMQGSFLLSPHPSKRSLVHILV